MPRSVAAPGRAGLYFPAPFENKKRLDFASRSSEVSKAALASLQRVELPTQAAVFVRDNGLQSLQASRQPLYLTIARLQLCLQVSHFNGVIAL
ncbi:MAG: hypothetical protein AAF829_04035 [Pseudomonadota bacterium]